jgi:predicted AAA+ superfamily ATPase
LGIRNSLIQNYNPLSLREDTGSIWENFCIIERMKKNSASQVLANIYFWRSYAGQEVDYIEESGGKLEAFEFKWGEAKGVKAPSEFLKDFQAVPQVINRKNYLDFAAKD